jgi:hypothetical protein
MTETSTKLIEKQCQKHLLSQGITSKEKLMCRLQEIFEQAEHQERALIELYRMLIPDWERLERLEGFPVVGQEMWQYICRLFVDYDQRKHPQVLNGGLWIHAGFSYSGDLAPWEISMDRCHFIYS